MPWPSHTKSSKRGCLESSSGFGSSDDWSAYGGGPSNLILGNTMARGSLPKLSMPCCSEGCLHSGTTVLAATFRRDKGVLLISDTRISQRIDGDILYEDNYMKKIRSVVKHRIYLGFSGTLSHCEFVHLKTKLEVKELQRNQVYITVPHAASIAKAILEEDVYNVELLIAGFDKYNGALVFLLSRTQFIRQNTVLAIGSGYPSLGLDRYDGKLGSNDLLDIMREEMRRPCTFDPYTSGIVRSVIVHPHRDVQIEINELVPDWYNHGRLSSEVLKFLLLKQKMCPRRAHRLSMKGFLAETTEQEYKASSSTNHTPGHLIAQQEYKASSSTNHTPGYLIADAHPSLVIPGARSRRSQTLRSLKWYQKLEEMLCCWTERSVRFFSLWQCKQQTEERGA